MGSIILGKHLILWLLWLGVYFWVFIYQIFFFRIDAMILGNPMSRWDLWSRRQCDSKGPENSNRPVTRKWRFPQNPLQKGYAFALKLHSRKEFNGPLSTLTTRWLFWYSKFYQRRSRVYILWCEDRHDFFFSTLEDWTSLFGMACSCDPTNHPRNSLQFFSS